MGDAKSGAFTKPRMIQADPPDYPLGLRHTCWSGPVGFESVLDATGKVAAFYLAQSGGGPLFDLGAMQAIHKWRFSPAQLDGKAVPVLYLLTTTFYTRCRPEDF